MNERKIGFIQGLVYSAALIKEYKLDAEQLLNESGFTTEDLKRYADEYDLEKLGLD
ncbi:hypothetical protein [Lederbergia lenta]|uniref:hypothetical protein n=1 Tax=Lederbergia lenta TaxID=1467 RepID=UPI002041F936|nr:hypothetical protein [Lederbergia lenta]MCM3109961.1 hypothetical protein [Lederbergia lenta]